MALHFLVRGVPGRRVACLLWSYLPALNFITLHYLYFIGTCLITSVIFWGSSTPEQSIGYTDSLFLVISAMTEAGLNTVNLSEMNTFQQWMLWMLIMAGSSIFVSISVVFIRKKAFEKRFGRIVKAIREQREETKRSSSRHGRVHSLSNPRQEWDSESAHVILPNHLDQGMERHHISSGVLGTENADVGLTSAMTSTVSQLAPGQTAASQTADPARSGGSKESTSATDHSKADHVAFAPDIRYNGAVPNSTAHKRRLSSSGFSLVGAGANKTYTTTQKANNSNFPPKLVSSANTRAEEAIWHSQLHNEVISRNSQFHGLTREERDRIGGVEYQAISLLAWLVPTYFVLWQLFGCIALGAYMHNHQASIAKDNGVNPWWLGAFNAVSAFNNSGMSVLDANMVPFQSAFFMLITMGLLILAGNTAYPPFLRLIIWVMLRLLPKSDYYEDWRETLQFILDHPRRVYTNLFPSRQNWWLVFTLVVLNGVDWAAFELLNIGNPAIESIPANARALDGLFQALAVRSGGFYVVDIPSLRIGVQTLYVGMMYLSAFPVVITMRNSNVYEERSLGIYASDEAPQDDHEKRNPFRRFKQKVTGQADDSRAYFIRQQLRGQLAHDLPWLGFAILLIVCIEVSNFERDPVTYSVFNVVFEVVSGYGCVGITTGLPNEAHSFSGGWHTASKLILCLVMLRGRHRGLPVAIDRAVLLPREGMMGQNEEEDHDMRTLSRQRTNSHV